MAMAWPRPYFLEAVEREKASPTPKTAANGVDFVCPAREWVGLQVRHSSAGGGVGWGGRGNHDFVTLLPMDQPFVQVEGWEIPEQGAYSIVCFARLVIACCICRHWLLMQFLADGKLVHEAGVGSAIAFLNQDTWLK